MAPAPGSDLGEAHLGAVVEVVAFVVEVGAVVVVDDVDEEVLVLVLVVDVPLVDGVVDGGLEGAGPPGGGDPGAGAEPSEPPTR